MTGLLLIWEILASGILTGEADPEFSDLPLPLPSEGVILDGEARKAVTGQPFFYFPPGEEQKKNMPGTANTGYYFDLFDKFEIFGLPKGGGFGGELPWLVEFLQRMTRKKTAVENGLEREASKKWQR